MKELIKQLREDINNCVLDMGAGWNNSNCVSEAQETLNKLENKIKKRINVSSCYAVFDNEEGIVKLYQTEDRANKGLWEFQNSNPYIEFYVDTMQIN